jgi:predicted O-methyltransferase YrrM
MGRNRALDRQACDGPRAPLMLDGILGRVAVAGDYARIVELLDPIEGFLHTLEGYALLLIAEHGPGTGVVVEIGSYLGRSTCFLALGAKRGTRPPVVAVDHFGGSPEHQPGASHESAVLKADRTTYNQFLHNLKRTGLEKHVRPIRAPSVEAARGWREPIRLLFIDGDHSYEASRTDFAAWSPRVEANGLVAFHDVGVWPGISRFYAELIGEGRWRERAKVRSLRIVRRA